MMVFSIAIHASSQAPLGGLMPPTPPKKSKIIVRHKSFFAIPRFLKLGGMISQNGSWLKMRDADLSSFIFRGLTVFVLLSSNMFFATWAGGLPNVRSITARQGAPAAAQNCCQKPTPGHFCHMQKRKIQRVGNAFFSAFDPYACLTFSGIIKLII